LKKYALLVAMTASCLTPFMGSSVNLAAPSIGREFNTSALMLSWVVTSYILASAAFLVPFGRLADIVGRKRIFLIGMAVFSLSSLLCGLARTVEALIVFRVIQGVGSSMMFGTSVAILTSVFPPQERGRVLGLTAAMAYTGLSLGPVLGGSINHNLGWQYIFYLNALIGALIAYLSATKLRGEWAGARGESYDLIGSVLYSLGLLLFMYGLSSMAVSVTARFMLGAGLVVLAIFARQQMGSPYPILNMMVFSQNITFTFANLAALLNYSANFAVTFLLSLHLQVVAGYDSQTAGLILLSQPVVMALLSPFAGRLSDRVEPRLVSSLGMVLTTLGLLVFCFLSANTPVWEVAGNLVLLGIGFALFSSPNSNSIMGSVERRFYGVAASTLSTMRLTGQAISMAIVTLMLALYLGSGKLVPAYSDLLVRSARMSFAVFAGLCLVGVFASLARGSLRERPEPGL